MAPSTTLLLLPLFRALSPASAHTRLECPPPRSGETGAKLGPCDAPDDPSLPAYPLHPGLNTITWLESIPHPGAPGRIALSLDGDDSTESFESCLLLDHVPHDEYSVPDARDELTWHRASITVWVPDVRCERCHLQLMTVMSDEIHGVPEGSTCAYGGALETGRVAGDLPACPVVYHSCAPVSIDGSVPRNEIAECDTAEFEEKLGWPMRPADDADLYSYSKYYYKGDPGIYDLATSRLLKTGAPIEGCASFQFCDPAVYLDVTNVVPDDAPYTSMEGTCAAMVGMEVEAFQLGVLPDTPRNISAEDLVPPGGEVDPCDVCQDAKPCFYEACALRDAGTGLWSGPAEPCNDGAFCEFCFPDSACLGFGGDAEGEDAAVPADEDGGAAGDPVPPSGEADPCDACEPATACFYEACALRDVETGVWAGAAEQCNAAKDCGPCFPDSACLGVSANGDHGEDGAVSAIEDEGAGAAGGSAEEAVASAVSGDDENDAATGEEVMADPENDAPDEVETPGGIGEVEAPDEGVDSSPGFIERSFCGHSIGMLTAAVWTFAVLA